MSGESQLLDWQALRLSLQLAALTALCLLPLSLWLGRLLAYRRFPGKALLEAAVALPLVLPPTVLGYYLLVAWSPSGALGASLQALAGVRLVFSFEGLLLASVLVNLPFAIQPAQRAFEGVPRALREAGLCSGLTPWRTFWRIELPLAWPGVVTAMTLTFAHTLGEFGVVLMVGGNIPGETRTAAISLYDSVQRFDSSAAAAMAATLLLLSMLALALVYTLTARRSQAYDG